MTVSEYRDDMAASLLRQARAVLSALGGAGCDRGGFLIPHEDVMHALAAVETLIEQALHQGRDRD